MGTSIDNAVKRQVVAEIRHAGEALILPEKMTTMQAIDLLQRRLKSEEEEVILSETYDAFPWDGAVALQSVLKKKFGWAEVVPTPGMFGPQPPQFIPVEIGYEQTVQVPWGQFSLPTIPDGRLQTGTTNKNGRVVFVISAKVKRKYEDYLKQIFADVKAELKTNSIYRGKAVKLRFLDDDGDPLAIPTVAFMDTSGISEDQLVFSEELMVAVNTSLFTPIRRAQDCLTNKIPLKRGILLGGTYGCGKTLAAVVASKIAVDSGITFIYAERAGELGQAVEFAKQYQSPAAVVFCEDIDRSMSGDRSVDMDDILNTIDGIESKKNNIIVVLTTNALEDINTAMIRPGRLDAVIDVTPPDAKAVEKLIRLYGGRMIHADTDLRAVGLELAGNIPAVIAEVVKRAKLHQLSHQLQGTQLKELSATALLESAKTMTRQIALLKKQPAAGVPSLDSSLADLMHRTLNNGAADGVLHRIEKTVDRIYDNQ